MRLVDIMRRILSSSNRRFRLVTRADVEQKRRELLREREQLDIEGRMSRQRSELNALRADAGLGRFVD